MDAILVFAVFALVVAACVYMGSEAAMPGRSKVFIVVTLIIAWVIGTLVVGVPAYAAGWIYRRHRPKAVAPADPARWDQPQ